MSHLEFPPNVRKCFCMGNLFHFAAAISQLAIHTAPWGWNIRGSGSWTVPL